MPGPDDSDNNGAGNHDGEPDREAAAREESERLIRRLKSLPEAAMRRQVLVEKLQEMQPAGALVLFDEVTRGAARRKHAHLVALEAVHRAVLTGQEIGPLYELLAEVYRLAREEDNQAVAHLLMIARPSRGPLGAEEVPGDHEMSQLTLGQRRFLARCHDRTRLDRLLYDPDPGVVCNLLRNPHLTEQDVVRLASRRPTRAVIQREIHQSRWGDRYRIRVSLVCNPYTPPELSVKLCGFLLRKELRQVAGDASLHQLVRDEARQLLRRRSASRQAPPEGDPEAPD